MCIKKFLFCLPPRIGSIILAYVGIVTSIAVLCFFTYVYCVIVSEYRHAVKTSQFSLEYEPGEVKLSRADEQLAYQLAYMYMVAMVFCYFFVHILFIIFSILLAIGAHNNKRCLVKTYFVYGFFHFFFCLFLASLHFFLDEYLQTALIVAADVLYAVCLCGVKGLLDSINSGQIYAQPGPAYKS